MNTLSHLLYWQSSACPVGADSMLTPSGVGLLLVIAVGSAILMEAVARRFLPR